MSELRKAGTYRAEDGSIEVIVDIPESASWVEDQWPDEVAFIREQAVAEVRREHAMWVEATYGGDGRTAHVVDAEWYEQAAAALARERSA